MSTSQLVVRPPAAAGLFYPAEPAALRAAISQSFAGARPAPRPQPPDTSRPDRPATAQPRAPKALVVPHAGYVYSGPIAASGFQQLTAARETVHRVVLLGPSHRVPLRGLAVSAADGFATPLGQVPIDSSAREAALKHPAVRIDDGPHASEHSLEVQVPFLQTVLREFTLVPLAVGRATAQEITDVIESWLGGPDTVIVVSTDLSHYDPYETARVRDRQTSDAIVACAPDEIGDRDACGAYPLRGLLVAARRAGLSVTELDLRNSGDTAGDRQRVVGYGSFAFA